MGFYWQKWTRMSKWVEGTVTGRRQWTDSLVSLNVHAPEVTFVAGQFARIGLPAPAGAKEAMLGRPYSFVNPPGVVPHEFYFNVVPGGPLSPRLAALGVGEPVWLLASAAGFFTIAEVPAAPTLWCLATGTGIGPFLSMLRTDEPWDKFERAVLVHAVRYASDLTYQDAIAGIAQQRMGRLTVVALVSRETNERAVCGRIPAALENGRLEARAGAALTAEGSHAMLCGNPDMVRDVQLVLAARGMRRHRRREPGHYTVETYW
jgi:ferredoxin--NADP+ reductase